MVKLITKLGTYKNIKSLKNEDVPLSTLNISHSSNNFSKVSLENVDFTRSNIKSIDSIDFNRKSKETRTERVNKENKTEKSSTDIVGSSRVTEKKAYKINKSRSSAKVQEEDVWDAIGKLIGGIKRNVLFSSRIFCNAFCLKVKVDY